jgi:hypothetical protein
MSDKNPPRIFHTADNIEWAFLQTFPDYEKLQKFRLNNHSFASWPGKRNRIRFYCNSGRGRAQNCKFMLLALKTTKRGYHVYKHGEHNHGIKVIEDDEGEDAEEKEMDEEEEEEDEEEKEEEVEVEEDEDVEEENQVEEEEETANGPIEHERGNTEGGASMEVDGIEWPFKKCQRRLNSALRRGQMERAKKWMERIEATEIDQVITEMNKGNMTKLVGMANSDIGINKRR